MPGFHATRKQVYRAFRCLSFMAESQTVQYIARHIEYKTHSICSRFTSKSSLSCNRLSRSLARGAQACGILFEPSFTVGLYHVPENYRYFLEKKGENANFLVNFSREKSCKLEFFAEWCGFHATRKQVFRAFRCLSFMAESQTVHYIARNIEFKKSLKKV